MATIVAFHAHPDDEVLLTGGTLARQAAEGHRVVIAVACNGVVRRAPGPGERTRPDELRDSAAVLGAVRGQVGAPGPGAARAAGAGVRAAVRARVVRRAGPGCIEFGTRGTEVIWQT